MFDLDVAFRMAAKKASEAWEVRKPYVGLPGQWPPGMEDYFRDVYIGAYLEGAKDSQNFLHEDTQTKKVVESINQTFS